MAKSLAELCSCPNVLWKIELVSNEIEFLFEKISKQSVKVAAWVLLTAHSQIQAENKELNRELLIKNEAGLNHYVAHPKLP